jgi:DNA-binding NarL/FixJ family response regulator
MTAEAELSDGGAAILAYARARDASGWRLPPEVGRAAAAHPDQTIVLTSHAAPAARAMEQACRAYGLSDLQTRVALETIRTGHARLAARRLGISYDNARAALSEAMHRVRARRLPGLVNRLTSLAFGVLPQADAADVLGDLWGVTRRQAMIAGLVAEGLSRAEAAAALSISEAVVKKELDRVYQLLQVASAAALARKLVEAQAMRWLTRATGGDIGFLDDIAEPLQFVPRPDGGRIAVSDYGPSSGRPVLVAHSSVTTRPVARRLVRALQAAGWRPFSIDRPGFGLSDPLPGARPARHDPWATAAADTLLVLDHLKLELTDVVARGAAQYVLALARLAPQRLGRVVLVNPDPDSSASRLNVGHYGVIKTAFQRNPAIIRLTIALMLRRLDWDRFYGIAYRALRGSPPDEAALQDGEIMRDYFRAQRTFAAGRLDGVVNEQTAFARGSRPPPMRAPDWRVLVAAHDTLHAPKDVLDYWRAVLPDSQFRLVSDAGRLLALTHPHYVVEALSAAQA